MLFMYSNKKTSILIIGILLSFSFFSCKSIQTSVLNSASTALAGVDKKGVPSKVKPTDPNPMEAFMAEKDPVIVQEVLPTIVKLYEIMHIENPNHQGIEIMCGSLNVMYANLCVQTPAESFGIEELDEQVAEFERAKLHYLKGRDYIVDAFDSRWPGFRDAVLGQDDEKIADVVAHLSEADVNAIYWACAGTLASFSLDPINPDALGTLRGTVAMLEKAAALNPDYSDGALWDIMCQFYTAAPMDFGGDAERGKYCYEQAMRVSGGKTPGLYITYAESFCKPSGDRQGFLDSLNEALKINPDENPSSLLMSVISQQKANRLIKNVDEYFVEW